MPFWLLLMFAIGLTIAFFAYLVPLQVLARRVFWLSHGMIWVGMWFVWGFVVYMMPGRPLADFSMLMGGLLTGGGLCMVAVHVVRRLHEHRE